MAKIVLFHKPYNVLSQFTCHADSQAQTLKEYIPFEHVYPAGRLDRDSEGLLALTDDGAWQHRIAHPANKMSKTYWAQIEGIIDLTAMGQLQSGVELKDGKTLPARCQRIPEPYLLEPRQPPIRTRKNIPSCWIELTLKEGRNRQVRRMCAAVGYPVLRLIRYRIGSWTLDGIRLGEYRVLETN